MVERAQKDAALHAIADAIEQSRALIAAANAKDVAAGRETGLSAALLDRLVLNDGRMASMVQGVRQIAALEDPVGEVTGMRRRPNGLVVGQVRIPLGVIAMIYESRPNVTVDAAALAIKSGNAVLLRGGKEAVHSNRALGDAVAAGLSKAGLPTDGVQIVKPMAREDTKVLVSLAGEIDLLIPRGGAGLIRFVTENARVPVIQHYEGVCHIYVDAGADLDAALSVVKNAKLSRPGVCNALECLLVHATEAPLFLPRLAALIGEGLEVRGDTATVALLPSAIAANDGDWGTEFLAPTLAVKVVPTFEQALDHIHEFGSNHTESICTRDYGRAQRFLREIDASCVMVNASTRFNDGSMLGLGAEMGISTSKLHAYGPMGVSSLTTLKWIVQGDGHVR